MTNLYEVDLKQESYAEYGDGIRESYHELARSAEEAIRKAVKEARSNGFLKSKPIRVLAVKEIAHGLK